MYCCPRVFSTAVRVIRTTPAMGKRATATAGSQTYDHPWSPPNGAHLSQTPKTKIKMIATQNAGAAWLAPVRSLTAMSVAPPSARRRQHSERHASDHHDRGGDSGQLEGLLQMLPKQVENRTAGDQRFTEVSPYDLP